MEAVRAVEEVALAGARLVMRRQLPLRSAGDQVDDFRRALGDATTVGSRVRFATEEGEWAALATLRNADGRLAALGIVFGDETLVEVRALALDHAADGDFVAAVRGYLTAIRLDLGADRRRPFWYHPPTAWRAHLLSDGSAQWHAPEPQRTSIIGVGLAERAGAMNELAERIAGRVQLPLLPLGEPCPFLSTHGLSGQLWRASAVDGRSVAEIVILEDGRFHYPLWLEIDCARVADDLRQFADVVASIEPLPARAPAFVPANLAMWG